MVLEVYPGKFIYCLTEEFKLFKHQPSKISNTYLKNIDFPPSVNMKHSVAISVLRMLLKYKLVMLMLNDFYG